MNKYARYFASNILQQQLLQQQHEQQQQHEHEQHEHEQQQQQLQIIVKLTANLGGGKTYFVDLVKSWLANSNILSQGLSFFGFNIIEFELDGKQYKLLHLDASLMKSQRLLKKIPVNIKEYQFIFIEHPHLIIYRDLLKELKLLKTVTEINIRINIDSGNRDFDFKGIDMSSIQAVEDIPSKLISSFQPESDKIPAETLRQFLTTRSKCILAIDATCDDVSITIIIKTSHGFSILYNKTITMQQEGSIHEYLELEQFIFQELTKMYEEIEKLGCEINLICVSNTPGLPISLKASMLFAHNLARQLNIPIMFLNHIYSHMFAGLDWNTDIQTFSGIVISGGHFIFATYNEKFKVHFESNTDTIGGCIDKIWAELRKTLQPFGKFCEDAMNKFNKEDPRVKELLKLVGPIKNVSDIKSKLFELIYKMLLQSIKNTLLQKWQETISLERIVYFFLEKIKRTSDYDNIMSQIKSGVSQECDISYGNLSVTEDFTIITAYILKYQEKIKNEIIKKEQNASRLFEKKEIDIIFENLECNIDSIEMKESLIEYCQDVYKNLPRSDDFVGLFATVLHILIGEFLKKVLQNNLPHIKSCGNRLIVGGGCIFNKYLQSIIIAFCKEHEIEYIPTPQHLCIDNSQMVIMHANHILENVSRLCETTPFEIIEQKAFEAGLRMPLEVTADSLFLNNEKVGI